MVSVEQIDEQALTSRDRCGNLGVLRLAGITERSLPEADLTRCNVEVAGEPAEAVERRVVGLGKLVGVTRRIRAPADVDPVVVVGSGRSGL
jgi:hypothetical protein